MLSVTHTTMLSIERVRELMNEPTLSDEEATRIRDICHALAESIIEAAEYQEELKKNPPSLF